jgi:hypothetical protein
MQYWLNRLFFELQVSFCFQGRVVKLKVAPINATFVADEEIDVFLQRELRNQGQGMKHDRANL